MKRLLTITAALLIAAPAFAQTITGPMPRDPAQRADWFARNPGYNSPSDETITKSTNYSSHLAALDREEALAAEVMRNTERAYLAGTISRKTYNKEQKRHGEKIRSIERQRKAIENASKASSNYSDPSNEVRGISCLSCNL